MNRLVLTILCTFMAGIAAADLAGDVRCREIGFSRSVESRDVEAFRSYIDADARFISAGVLRGVREIVEGWSVFFANDGPTIKWRPEVVEVLDSGALALSRGPYRVVSSDKDGNKVERWGTFNSIWRLDDDGQWRVVFDAGSPAAEAPGDETRALLDAKDDCR